MSISSVYLQKRRGSTKSLAPDDFKEGVLFLKTDDIYIQRYFTVYDTKIAYAFRGKEKGHEFSPLTSVFELNDAEAPAGHFAFRIETEGQKHFDLASPTQEERADWMKAIVDETQKLISTILYDCGRKGFGPYLGISEGTLINEGTYSSYVLRKQGSKVVPLFLIIKDGKIIAKRDADHKENVGSWRLSPKAKVEINSNFAGAAFCLDKEILLVSNASIRSNWIVALRSSIQKTIYSKNLSQEKFQEIDFGIPQESEDEPKPASESEKPDNQTKGKSDKMKTLEPTSTFSGTIFKNSDKDDDGNRFYKSFAGSVRVTGKVEIEDFAGTFRENESMEDDQQKFANIQLEFEEYTENDHDPGITAAIVADEDEVMDLPTIPGIPGLNFKQDEDDDDVPREIIVPISRGDSNIKKEKRRSRAPSNAGLKNKPKFMRIKLKSKSPEGPIRVYRGSLEHKDPFKTIIVSSESKASDVLAIVLEDYQVPLITIADKKYVLVEEEVETEPGQEPYARVLDPRESPFITKLNWDHRTMRFAIRSQYEFTKEIENVSTNLFRVHLMDGTISSIKFNENLSFGRVCEIVAEKFSLQKSSYQIFSMWMVGESLELQLEPFQQVKVMIQDWPLLERKFVESSQMSPFQLNYKRWAFLSKSAERRCRDPVAIHFLYEQALSYVMSGLYPINTEGDDLILLSSLRCHLMFGDYNPEIHSSGYIIRNTEDLKLLVPAHYISSLKKQDFESKVMKLYKQHATLPKMITQMLYLQCLRQLPYYGATFFNALMVTTTLKGTKRASFINENTSKSTPVRVGVNVEGIHIIETKTLTLLLTEELKSIEICTDMADSRSFAFEVVKTRLEAKVGKSSTLERVKDKEPTFVYLLSPQAPLIEAFVTSAIKQQEEDHRALQIMRDLQRKRSATDIEKFYEENITKTKTMTHVVIPTNV